MRAITLERFHIVTQCCATLFSIARRFYETNNRFTQKHKLLHENEIVQYLQNYKYQDIDQDYFRKALYKLHEKTAHEFFTRRTNFSYFLSIATTFALL